MLKKLPVRLFPGPPGGGLACNFNSLEPQNPQKTQKLLFPLRLVIRRLPDPPCSILLRKLEGKTACRGVALSKPDGEPSLRYLIRVVRVIRMLKKLPVRLFLDAPNGMLVNESELRPELPALTCFALS